MRNDTSAVRPQLEVLSRIFPGRLEQVRRVREFAGMFLQGSPLAVDVQQVVSELAANAARHTRSGEAGGWFLVELCRWRHMVSVLVADQGGTSRPPSRFDLGHLAEHGRGLLLVAQLSTWSGWYGDTAGRTFVAVLLNDEPGS